MKSHPAQKRHAGFQVAILFAALGLIGIGIWNLEAQRSDIAIEQALVGQTPVTYFHAPGSGPAPLIVVAHGFAGSRPLMEAYSLSLARAGYLVAAFDFMGHGRNPVPMRGDIDSIQGTTRLLVDETLRVAEAGLTRPQSDGRVAILGHSMASDIVIRAAGQINGVGAVVAISPFSQAVTPTHPQNLLMLVGEWEPGLRDFVLKALQMVDPTAVLGETARSANGKVLRRAVAAPNVEHVAVLFSPTAIREAVDWLNTTFGRSLVPEVPRRGVWILAALCGAVTLVWPLTRLMAFRDMPTPASISRGRFASALLVPMVAAPAAAIWFPAGFLPVLVADYLAIHMLAYGLLQIALLRFLGLQFTGFALVAGILFAAYGIFVLGFGLDRYVFNFLPHTGRLPVIAVLGIGAVAFMLADSAMAHANPQFWRRVCIRLAFLCSLAIAVALDFERLFFLVLIIPVILMFFLTFGLMGRWVEARAGPLASGLGLGLVLAWSLGVAFPMIA